MRVVCSICKEIFVPFSEVKVTNCGHLYHSACIEKWTERNKSCPLCRTNLTLQPFRVYFDVEQGESADPSTLEHQLEVLTDKLKECERLTKTLMKSNDKHEEILESMKEYSKHLGNRNEMLKTSLNALKEKFAKELKKNKKLKIDLDLWMTKARSLEGLEHILNGTAEDVNSMLAIVPVTEKSVKQLCTYVQVLKGRIQVCEEKNLKLVKEKDKFSKLLAEEKKKFSEEANKSCEIQVVNSQKTISHLTKLVNDYRKKIKELEESKTENSGNSKVQQKKVVTKTDLADIFLREEMPKGKEVQAKKINVINNWEDIVSAGPSKGYKRSFSVGATYPSSSVTEISMSSNYAFDGMGGSKKIRMASIVEKRQENTLIHKNQNKIYNYFLNNDN